jgi:inorganic pyrophosphatase
MIDGDEADDKIIGVLDGYVVYGDLKDIHEAPPLIIERLKHYFLTYKDMPGQDKLNVEITHTYGAEEAQEVIRRSLQDYQNKFDTLQTILSGY